MAISIDFPNKVILVPQADLTFIAGSIYELDTDVFRQALNDLQDDATGMPFDTTHEHLTEVTIAGVTYARFVRIINGYTVCFEDGVYTVNLVGSNNNIFTAGVLKENSVTVIGNNANPGASITFVEENVLLAEPVTVAKDEPNNDVVLPEDLVISLDETSLTVAMLDAFVATKGDDPLTVEVT